MGFVILWVLMGCVSAYIAHTKGRGTGGWFLAGALLGPFGIVWALVQSPVQKALDERAADSGEMKKCPDCAELVRSEARKCRFCGAELATAAVNPAPPPPDVQGMRDRINTRGLP